MRRIQLEPERREPPSCVDFTSMEAVRAYERAVRIHRAFTEPFVVQPLEARADGTYAVLGASRIRYAVDIVDRGGLHDACTCPDFLTNELGACKHIEAVRRAIHARRPLRKAFERLDEAPSEPVLAIHLAPALRLRAVGGWSRALRDRYAGLLRSRISSGVGDEAISAGRRPDGVRVLHGAIAAIAKLRERAQREARHRSVARAVSAGRVHVDVLLRPLFPYQREGVLHLLRAGRAMLADDMGLGKTVQAIAACELLRRRGEATRILIVTAASIKHQWAQEIHRYTGERAEVIGGGAAARRRAIEAGAAYTILNYELTWRELTMLKELPADVLILDEAQRAKNFRTKTATTLRSIPSQFLFVLTGTPIENRLDDLYALLQLVDPSVLGPLWRFNMDFHVQSERGRVTGYKNLAKLRERIAPVVLRRRKEEVLHDLPPLVEQTRYTALSREQIELEGGYRADAARLMAVAERRPLRKREQDVLMMLLLKARQACNALELCDPGRKKRASPKLDEFEALVSEMSSEDAGKILVFSEWVEMLKLAAARLDRLGVGYRMLHGGVPTDARPALLERFRDDPDVRVLLSTDAGGVGLNLQVATFVVHLDLPWNPARLDQRTARAHRLGQTRGVVVTYLCAEQGIERGIEGTLAGKRAVRAAALNPTAQVDELEAPSFSVFLRQMRDIFEEIERPRAPVVDEAPREASEMPLLAEGAEVPLLAEGSERTFLTGGAGVPLPAKGPEAPLLVERPDMPILPESPAASLLENGASSSGPEAEVALLALPKPAGPHETLAASGVGAELRPWQVRARNRLDLARLVHAGGFFGDALRAAYEALAAAIGGLGGGSAPEGHPALVALIYRELLPNGKLPADAHAVLARLHDLTTLERSGVPIEASLAQRAVEDAEAWSARLGAILVAGGGHEIVPNAVDS